MKCKFELKGITFMYLKKVVKYFVRRKGRAPLLSKIQNKSKWNWADFIIYKQPTEEKNLWFQLQPKIFNVIQFKTSLQYLNDVFERTH